MKVIRILSSYVAVGINPVACNHTRGGQADI